MKPIVYITLSSGIREGAWEGMRLKHITPMKNGGAMLLVYPGSNDQYTTFMTPEAYSYFTDYINYRKENGSYVIRNKWRETNVKHGAGGLATKPRPFKKSGIKRLLERAAWAQALRKPLPDGVRRQEWQTVNGLRKFFKTQAEKAPNLKSGYIERLMGHHTGLDQNYWKMKPEELLEQYSKAIPYLTIEKQYDEINVSREKIESESKSKENEILTLREQITAAQAVQATFDEKIRELEESSNRRSQKMVEQFEHKIKYLYELLEPLKKIERQKMELEREELIQKSRQKYEEFKAYCKQNGKDLQTAMKEEIEHGSFFSDSRKIDDESPIRWDIAKDDVYKHVLMPMTELLERNGETLNLPNDWRNFKTYDWDKYWLAQWCLLLEKSSISETENNLTPIEDFLKGS
jgi:hypothetical protein